MHLMTKKFQIVYFFIKKLLLKTKRNSLYTTISLSVFSVRCIIIAPRVKFNGNTTILHQS